MGIFSPIIAKFFTTTFTNVGFSKNLDFSSFLFLQLLQIFRLELELTENSSLHIVHILFMERLFKETL